MCRKGLHKMTPENTYILPSKGWKLCRECRTQNAKKDLQKHKEKRYQNVRNWHKENKEKVSEYHKKMYAKIASFIRKEKDKPCTDCGVKYPHYVMDFDHVGDDKLLNVGRCRSFEKTIEEIKKM